MPRAHSFLHIAQQNARQLYDVSGWVAFVFVFVDLVSGFPGSQEAGQVLGEVEEAKAGRLETLVVFLTASPAL